MKPAFPFTTRRLMMGGLLTLLAACAGTPATTTPNQADDIARVETYLNTSHGLQANFVQTWPDGGKGQGIMHYDPGRLRLDYATPGSMKLVAADGHLLFVDHRRESVTRMSLGRQPLGLLLDQPVHLSGQISVTAVQHGQNSLQVSLGRRDSESQGILTLGFADIGGKLSLLVIEMTDVERQHIRLDLTDTTVSGQAWPDTMFTLSSSN
ncbi:cell envelope biogenesis protein LolA [Komagataeibacter nataicola]|uniref:Cell envelope biogenesis protein LolA n=1 Tax=Komagataeibacter nataicola TaxID=265960 RepID=A0A9N7C6K7_9PROT|nr:outer membrane lipoprotein carrier protein LolA [Komagataeibacter nataicola]AQU86482.1 cell envelope biogenesis protein LolA [Komagataeibacter nataicola]PYD65831.1 cell envelope biogenesis protein LolA [Komagataeibacter nataicola]WEQ56623.1 outer membrane lipoprotein carrier protein LolA [Komagataeibacter nataicola]WNM08099.1 outer membrane lipoprotein carrier protein LolA [Komagataeibacter nataicola]GBR19492.1 outer-membrane lipoprotein carrier protein [Komagataeibacter nataicola NRIC 0616